MVTAEEKESGFKLVCKDCGRTLRYHFEDIQTGRFIENYSGDKTEHFIICPICGHKNSWWNETENYWAARDFDIWCKEQEERENRMF